MARLARGVRAVELGIPTLPKMGTERRFERVFKELSADADFEYVLIDGTIVRLHQHGAGAKGGPAARRSLARGVAQAPRSA